MKKIFASLMLTLALVLPVFATDSTDNTDLELIPKLGYLFSPEIKMDNSTSSDESTISLGLELFFDMQNNFFLGAGFMWANCHKTDDSDNKVGFSNVYVAAKYKFLVNDTEDDPFFVYPLLQLGVGMPSWEYSGPYPNFEIDGSFYWGLGFGGEYKNIVVELIYGCNYATMKTSVFKEDFTYTAFRINVGYKFVL